MLTTCSCTTKKALLLCAHGCGNTWNACPFRAVAERSFWRGVKLNCIMFKCVNAWQCFGRAQLERVGVGVVGVPGDRGLYNALSSPMFLSLSVSSLLGFLFLVSVLTLTVTIFGFLHLCSIQRPSPFVFAKCACQLNPLVFFPPLQSLKWRKNGRGTEDIAVLQERGSSVNFINLFAPQRKGFFLDRLAVAMPDSPALWRHPRRHAGS